MTAAGGGLGQRGPLASARSYLTRQRLTGASSVLIGSNVAIIVLRLASTVVLTRLLSPNDFGLIAIIGSIFYIIGMITDAGFEAFVIRHERGDEPHFLDAIWTIHLARGVLNAFTAAGLALPLAGILRKPDLAPLLAVAALSLALDGAASLTMLTAPRRSMVRRLAIVDLFTQSAQLLVGIIAAWIMRNAWALVVALIAGSAVRTLLSYVVFSDAARRLRLDRLLAGELWRFSRVIAASSALTLAISQVDKLVLARVLSLPQFGIYAIASNLAAAPTAIMGRYVGRIFYPALAASWRTEPRAIKDQYYKLRGVVFYGYLVAGGGLIGSAPLVVRILYDPRYLHAGFYLRLLAISTTLVMLTTTANYALMALGRTTTTLVTNAIRVAWLLPIGLTGLFLFGPIGLIVALALIEVPAYVYSSFVLIRHGLFDLRREIRSWVAIGGGLAWGLVCEGVASLIPVIR
jgi:lipopolysaccharide exporter